MCVREQETVSLDPKALANGLAEVYRIEALERIEAARRDLQVRHKHTPPRWRVELSVWRLLFLPASQVFFFGHGHRTLKAGHTAPRSRLFPKPGSARWRRWALRMRRRRWRTSWRRSLSRRWRKKSHCRWVACSSSASIVCVFTERRWWTRRKGGGLNGHVRRVCVVGSQSKLEQQEALHAQMTNATETERQKHAREMDELRAAHVAELERVMARTAAVVQQQTAAIQRLQEATGAERAALIASASAASLAATEVRLRDGDGLRVRRDIEGTSMVSPSWRSASSLLYKYIESLRWYYLPRASLP